MLRADDDLLLRTPTPLSEEHAHSGIFNSSASVPDHSSASNNSGASDNSSKYAENSIIDVAQPSVTLVQQSVPLPVVVQQQQQQQASLSVPSQQVSNVPQMKAHENEVAQWLASIELGEYMDSFIKNGYDDLDIIKEDGLNDKDLDVIGITKQGHRKKILVKIKQLQQQK